MKYYLSSVFIAILFALVSCDNASEPVRSVYNWDVDTVSTDYAKYVDPMIGTGGHGHTFPGACAPFGMVQLSPDTRVDGSWDGCSGYHHSDSIIYGFSHTHLSGTGCSDYGDIMLMPGLGTKMYVPGTDSTNGYRAAFSHANEIAEAGYYSVKLNSDILCELTASPRVGVHRYTFPNADSAWMILDMAHRDEVLECEIEIVDDHTIRGKRFSKAWATDQQLWFYAEFSEPFTHKMWSSGTEFDSKTGTTNDLKAMLTFEASNVEVKVALSPVSSENAKLNLDVETGEMTFDEVKEKVQHHWNSELAKIEVTSEDTVKKTIFYTALYHCFIAPNVYCDVNGDYQGRDHKVYTDTVHQRYTVFSLWDTYRALHPLFTIVQQKRTNDFINTFLQQYNEVGRLPVWELSSNETDCMIGYHSVSVIADAWMKGITDYDTALAYEAMKASAMGDRYGLEYYKQYGFIPAELESESVSKTLEYAYDDWCIAQCAIKMNDTAGRNYFGRRSTNWRNVYNPETGFMQARMNNSFLTPFNPFEVNNNYTEANAWQYSLAVQQDPHGLALIRSTVKFEVHLDSLFSVSSKTAGREQADISGLIGQYAHGNEPSHHMAYLYSSIFEDHKTQKLVHEICNTLYTDQPDGLCGNEDCGQMSAWYVLSSLGFYQVTPGKPEYTVGSPQFPRATIHLENGEDFVLTTSGADSDLPYCHVVGADGGVYPNYKLEHTTIMDGGAFQIEKHDTVYQNIEYVPTGIQTEGVSVPWITGITSRTFVDRATFGMKTLFRGNKIYYSINDGEFKPYMSPITITENSTIRMFSEGILYKPAAEIIYERNLSEPENIVGKKYSDTVMAVFFKAPAWKSISIRHAFAPQYSAGGDRALIDGLTGNENFRTGLWQGYEGVDMDVVIDLGKEMEVDSVYIGFLDDENAWIFGPTEVRVVVGNDSSKLDYNYKPDYIAMGGKPAGANVSRIRTAGGKGRYIRVLATGVKVCPQSHPGAGKPAWLFCDEISIIPK